MGSYYDSEVERQKKGDLTVNTVLPILAALETIATAKATRGQNVGTSTLGLIKDAHSRRAGALERAQKADSDAFTKNLQIGEASRASKRFAMDEAKDKRESNLIDMGIQDKGEIENRRLAAIDRMLGIPNEYDEATNTVTMGTKGLPGLSPLDREKIQISPEKFAFEKEARDPLAEFIGKWNHQIANPKPVAAGGGVKAPAGYRYTADGSLEAIPGGPADGAGANLTKGQEALDRNFAADYADYVAGGGFAEVQKNLTDLREVRDQLKAGKTNLTGPVTGGLLGFARPMINQGSVNAQERVESVAQKNLKLILGGQFAMKEGEQLIKRAYNPSLDETINAERLDGLIKQMETAAKTKQEASEYFEKNGTLNGFDASRLMDLGGGGDRPPAASGTVWRKGPDGREYEYDAATKAPTGGIR